jgi:uncharacterized OsmC-like protein
MGTDGIRDKIEAAVGYLTEHPDEARYRDSAATATIQQGLRVRVEAPDGVAVETDMPESVGGGNSGPSPGWLFRAALASCEATLIAMRAARQGVVLTSVEVVVDSESDDRGILGIDDQTPAGPIEVAVRVRVDSATAPDRVRAIIQWAHDHCPVQDATSRAVPVSLDIV